MTRSQISPLLGFIQSQNGRAGEFTIDPASALFSNSGGNTLGGGTFMVSEPVLSTVSGGSIPLKKLDDEGVSSNFSSTDKVEAGTFFKFSNHDKVYMTTQALDVTGSSSATFQEASITVNASRHASSPKSSGDLDITLSAVVVSTVGNSNSTVSFVITVSTLSSDTDEQIATKIVTAITADANSDGILASIDGDSLNKVNIEVVDKAEGGIGTRKVFVQNLVSNINVGETGIDTTVDNQETVGGSDIVTLYFDPPLRKPVGASTSLRIAPVNSVPFRVSLKEDIWSLDIDESEHYQPFSITFEESF